MIFKYKKHNKIKSINNIILRFQRKGCILYPIYKLVVINKKARSKKGRVLDVIGVYNPNFNERFFFFDSIKLYFWLEKSLIIHYKVKNLLAKFLLLFYYKNNF